MERLRCGLYVPRGEHMEELLIAAEMRGWDVVRICWDWPSLVTVRAAGRCQDGLAGSAAALPAARTPRVETLDGGPWGAVVSGDRPRWLVRSTARAAPPPAARHQPRLC